MTPEATSLVSALVSVTPFTATTVPPLGARVAIGVDAEKPTGEKFGKGETAVVFEHGLSSDGRVYVGVRTSDGRVLRSTFAEAFLSAW